MFTSDFCLVYMPSSKQKCNEKTTNIVFPLYYNGMIQKIFTETLYLYLQEKKLEPQPFINSCTQGGLTITNRLLPHLTR